MSPRQKFIPHGAAASLLWLAQPDRLTAAGARACAVDVLTYDQLGCLSPQAIYFPTGANFIALGDKLSAALEAVWNGRARGDADGRGLHQAFGLTGAGPAPATFKAARPLGVAARIAEARDVAFGLGHRVWLPPKRHLGWTLIHDPDATFQPSPLHGVIYLRQVSESKLAAKLGSVKGMISTVGVAGKISARAEQAFLSLGTTRFCPAGKMQFPPLTWHHDGRAPLADLVARIDREDRP